MIFGGFDNLRHPNVKRLLHNLRKSSLVNIEDPFKMSFFFLFVATVYAIIIFLVGKIPSNNNVLLVFLIVFLTLMVMYSTYKIGRICLPSNRRAELDLVGLSSEKIVEKLTRELDLYINYINQFIKDSPLGEEIPGWLSEHGRHCRALISVASRLLACEKENVVNVFLDGRDIPLIERTVEERAKNKRELEKIKKSVDSLQVLAKQRVLSQNDVCSKQEFLNKEEIRYKNNIALADKFVEAVKHRVSDVKKYPVLVDYSVAKIITESSTGKACKNFTTKLHGVIVTKDITDAERERQRSFLITLTRLKEGVPIDKLINIQDIQDSHQLELYLREFHQLNNEDIESICCNFRKHCDLFCLGNNINFIATFGYSNVVRRIIEHCAMSSDSKWNVYIVRSAEEREFLLQEEEIMKMELDKRNNIIAQIMDMEIFLEKDLHNRINLILLGAENVRTDGTVYHPRGRKKIIQEIYEKRKDKDSLKTVICAESYKVKNIECDPLRLAVYNIKDYSYFVSSVDVFETPSENQEQPFKKLSTNGFISNLDCCPDYWENGYKSRIELLVKMEG